MKLTRPIRHVFQRLYTSALRTILGPVLARERNTERILDERAVEYAFALEQIAVLYPKTVLDVGPGKTAFPHLLWSCGFSVTAVDKNEDPWSAVLQHGSLYNRHFDVMTDDITTTSLRSRFDVITCISVLEHIPDHDAAMQQMFTLLEQGGHLILTCPYNESAGVARLADLPDFMGGSYGKYTGVFSRSDVNRWLTQSAWEVIAQKYYQITTGDYYGMGRPVIPPRSTDAARQHQLTCMVLRKPS
jgi:SAM-dependent methyltransferase